MFDYPSAAELIAAARAHLERQVLPALADPRLRFQTLVAANVLAIAERELAAGDQPLRAAWGRLGGLLGAPEAGAPAGAELRAELAERERALIGAIQAGAFDAGPARERLAEHLRATALAELAVSNPRLLERAAADALRNTQHRGAERTEF